MASFTDTLRASTLSRYSRIKERQARLRGRPLTKAEAAAPYEALAETAGTRLTQRKTLDLQEQGLVQEKEMLGEKLKAEKELQAEQLKVERERLAEMKRAEEARLAEQKAARKAEMAAAQSAEKREKKASAFSGAIAGATLGF